jgi:hypothetical protein
MRAFIVIILVVLGTGETCADLGSVISSFRVGWPYGLADHYCPSVVRDRSYVYAVYATSDGDYLDKYTPEGEFLSRTSLGGWGFWSTGSDNCHLGDAFIALLWPDCILFFNKDNGSMIGSYRVASPTQYGIDNLCWDGTYYYVNHRQDYALFNRYTSSGSFAGVWQAPAWPSFFKPKAVAFAQCANSTPGRYLVATSTDNIQCLIDLRAGTVIAKWRFPGYPAYYGASVYGDAYPSSFGAACWQYGTSYDYSNWIYQIDIDARGAGSVLPASIGKIKAVYR